MPKKILIVDDEPSMTTYLSTLLQDNGYETISSSNAQEAYDLALSECPDLITLDLLMPEKTGIKLYRDLKKHPELGRIPVIIVTGFTSQQFPMIDFRKFIYERSIPGPEGFIEKPIDPEALLLTIGRVLGETPSCSV
ncbi:MAG: response regulator [Thermodesulfobacteriota bacterium]